MDTASFCGNTMEQDMDLQQRVQYPGQGKFNPHFQETYTIPPTAVPLGYKKNSAVPSALPYHPPPTPLPILVQPGVTSISSIPYPPQLIGYPAFEQSGPILGALEYLASLNQIFIKQKIQLLKAFTGFETNNKYRVLDPQGRQILYAKEDTDCWTRECGGSIRPFEMKLLDRNQKEVIHLVRPLACGSCCFPGCLQSIGVQAPPGHAIGTVEQKWSMNYPKYYVKDASGKPVYYIEGPWCTTSCFGSDVDFKIYHALNKGQVGTISKKWSGLAKEFFTDADNFGIQFPPGADPKMKAVLIGACVLIDFMYFEMCSLE